MQARGRALMGIGLAEGENRAVRAAEEAIICPLLEQSNIHGAKGVIVNIKGGCDVGMREVQDAVSTVQAAAHPDANIIFGVVITDEERADLQVTVIAAGFPASISQEYLEKSSSLIGTEKIGTLAPTAPDPVVADEPEIEVASDQDGNLLFPEEIPEDPIPLKMSEPEDDISIPAFMRKRKNTQ
jgi:cell division protein FtsZ